MGPVAVHLLKRPHLAIALIGCVFVADLIEPYDNVSICFAYTLPILLAVYAGPGSAYRLAALCALASLVGSFVRPPEQGIQLSFVANRVIAVAAQWLVAFLIEQRRRNHAVVERHLAEERHKAETGQRFVQILTHEIATALTSIDGQSYRLAKLAGTITPHDIVVRTDKIRQAAARLDAFIARIRLASEIGHGDIALARDAIHAGALLEPLVTAYDPARIRLDVRVPEPALYGDRDLIYQAASNLVSNAVKYSPAPADVLITVTRSERLDGTVIAVTDHGSGIPQEELDRVFEPYYRARNSSGIQGIGIGLHLVCRFVAAHGGEVQIESLVGSGTTVRLHLPGGSAP